MRYSAAPLGLMCTQTVVGVRGMALVSKAAGAVITSHAEAPARADLHQLSGVSAFSIIGVCLSLIVLNFSDAGEWLIAVANGF